MKRIAITKLMTNGGPCGDGTEVSITQISRNKAELECGVCHVKRTVALPGGRIDLAGFAALEDGVGALHAGDA